MLLIDGFDVAEWVFSIFENVSFSYRDSQSEAYHSMCLFTFDEEIIDYTYIFRWKMEILIRNEIQI